MNDGQAKNSIPPKTLFFGAGGIIKIANKTCLGLAIYVVSDQMLYY